MTELEPNSDQPHNPALERSVLAVLLAGTHDLSIQLARQWIRHPLAFYIRNHTVVYQACLDLDDQGERVDAQSVADSLSRMSMGQMLERLRKLRLLQEEDQLDGMSRSGLRHAFYCSDEGYTNPDDSALEAIGGLDTLITMAQEFSLASNLEQNAAGVWDYYLKRRMIHDLSRLVDRSRRTTDSFNSLMDIAQRKVLALSRLVNADQIMPMTSVLDEALDRVAKRVIDPGSGLGTGYADIDRRLGALRPGGLYVLAARPGAGKTTFALNIVRKVAMSKARVLFFSLEVDRVDLAMKMLVSDARLDFHRVESGTLTEDEQRHLRESAEMLRPLQLDVMDISHLTAQQIRSLVHRRTMETNGELGLVVIDYLQLLSADRKTMSEYEKVSEASRMLKIMAKDCRIPVLALSQMSRDSEKGSGVPRAPRLSDLRGSGSIEQDADAVIFLHNLNPGDDEQDQDQGREMKLIVAKNRFGPMGQVPMRFFPKRGLFLQESREEYYKRPQTTTYTDQPDDAEERLFF